MCEQCNQRMQTVTVGTSTEITELRGGNTGNEPVTELGRHGP